MGFAMIWRQKNETGMNLTMRPTRGGLWPLYVVAEKRCTRQLFFAHGAAHESGRMLGQAFTQWARRQQVQFAMRIEGRSGLNVMNDDERRIHHGLPGGQS